MKVVSSVLAQLAHQRVEDAQDVEVVPALGRGVRERLDQPLAGVLDRLHRVGDDEGAECGTADDDVLPGLPDDLDVTSHRHEAAEHAAEGDHETNDDRHGRAPVCSQALLKRFVLART
jgi:hypothetical protein